MKVKEIKDILNAKVLSSNSNLETEIHSACGADLMSDVLAFSKEKVLLLTGLVNPQVIRTAEMMDIRAVAFVRGKVPSPEIIELAEEKGMIVLTTEHPMYLACGLLYSSGLVGGGVKN